MGGCNKWQGRTLRQMHSKLTLDDKEFDAFLNHMIDTLEKMDIAEHLLEESKKIIEATRREVLNKARF